jgi:hypothetical protein
VKLQTCDKNKTFVASGEYREDLTKELGEYSRYGSSFSEWFSVYEGPGGSTMLVVNDNYGFMPGHVISLGQGYFDYEKEKLTQDLYIFMSYECHR